MLWTDATSDMPAVLAERRGKDANPESDKDDVFLANSLDGLVLSKAAFSLAYL